MLWALLTLDIEVKLYLSRFPSKLSNSISELKLHYSLLESDFLEFFPLLCGYCKKHPNAGNYKELPYFEI